MTTTSATRTISGRWLALALIVVAWAWGVAPLRAGELETKTFERAWSLIDRHFYDSEKKGLDWNAIHDQYEPDALAAESPLEVRAVIQRMLSELDASHCSVMDGDVYRGMMAELANKPAPTFGLVLEQTEKDRFFARAIFEGGPAAESGVELGDRIVAIDREPVARSSRLVDAGYDPGLAGPKLWFLRVGDDPGIELTIESSPERASRRNVVLEAAQMNGVDAMRNSARVVERGSVSIGVIHIWYCSRGVAATLRERIENELADCDSLVVDLRGRGGYSDVVSEVLEVFRGRHDNGLISRMRGTTKDVPPLWTKPVVFLIDARSRSAKEILAYRIRNEKVGVLVGERTEGAVLGATFHPLPDGSYLELPGMEVPVNGVSLEGVGVEPDVEASVDLPYAGGVDGILEAGLDIARERARQWRRGPY